MDEARVSRGERRARSGHGGRACEAEHINFNGAFLVWA